MNYSRLDDVEHHRSRGGDGFKNNDTSAKGHGDSPVLQLHATSLSVSRKAFRLHPTTHLELDGLGELSLLADDLGVTFLESFTICEGYHVIHGLGYQFAIQLARHLHRTVLTENED